MLRSERKRRPKAALSLQAALRRAPGRASLIIVVLVVMLLVLGLVVLR